MKEHTALTVREQVSSAGPVETSVEQMAVQVEQLTQQLLVRPGKRGRPATLSSLHLCVGVLIHFLRGWGPQLDLWRLLCTQAIGSFAPVTICDQAVYNRLARIGEAMQALMEQLSRHLLAQAHETSRDLAPFAHTVLALDESTLDRLKRWVPSLRQQPKTVLAGRLSALFDVRRQQWVRVDVLEDAVANCKQHARAMLAGVQKGSLLLFDRGYFSFEWFDELSARGLWWVSRYANRASYKVLWVCYEGDGVRDVVIQLGAWRADQAAHRVRMVSFWMQGTHYCYLTNLLDPQQLPVGDIARLYARRWDIEMAFRLLKEYLHLNVLWSAKWSVLQGQLWATLLLGQLVHASQHEIAAQAGVEPQDVSMPLLVRWLPRVLAQGYEPISYLAAHGSHLQLIRPSQRLQPAVPFVDALWVKAPPPEVLTPADQARHAHRNCGPRSTRG